MIVIMRTGCTPEELQGVQQHIDSIGLQGHLLQGTERTVIGVVGQTYPELQDELEILAGVSEVLRVSKPYKLSGREFKPEDTVVHVGNAAIGGDNPLVVMAGPCAVESYDQMMTTARGVKAAGAQILRGGAFKPRTSPYSFRGLGEEGLKYLAEARDETGLPVVTEVLAPSDVDLVARYADILQIGARNAQNYNLLEEVARAGKPVLLKRGFACTYDDLLLCAEYILAQGNRQLILCERGIRTFEDFTRNTIDLAAVPVIRKLSHLPIVVDPSHGTGKWYLVTPMAAAAAAAGAHALMIEVHPSPDTAKSDGAQSLTLENFARLMEQVHAVTAAIGRSPVQQAAG